MAVKDSRQCIVERIARMRAPDDQLDQYANQYLLTTEDQDREPNWDVFYSLWDQRLASDEDMAALVAEVMGVDYETALLWITY